MNPPPESQAQGPDGNLKLRPENSNLKVLGILAGLGEEREGPPMLTLTQVRASLS
jgi:hypothetical protein